MAFSAHLGIALLLAAASAASSVQSRQPDLVLQLDSVVASKGGQTGAIGDTSVFM